VHAWASVHASVSVSLSLCVNACAWRVCDACMRAWRVCVCRCLCVRECARVCVNMCAFCVRMRGSVLARAQEIARCECRVNFNACVFVCVCVCVWMRVCVAERDPSGDLDGGHHKRLHGAVWTQNMVVSKNKSALPTPTAPTPLAS
jgi:hypothetical protein